MVRSTEGIGVKYHKQPTETARGDFEQSSFTSSTFNADDVDIPEIDIH